VVAKRVLAFACCCLFCLSGCAKKNPNFSWTNLQKVEELRKGQTTWQEIEAILGPGQDTTYLAENRWNPNIGVIWEKDLGLKEGSLQYKRWDRNGNREEGGDYIVIAYDPEKKAIAIPDGIGYRINRANDGK